MAVETREPGNVSCRACRPAGALAGEQAPDEPGTDAAHRRAERGRQRLAGRWLLGYRRHGQARRRDRLRHALAAGPLHAQAGAARRSSARRLGVLDDDRGIAAALPGIPIGTMVACTSFHNPGSIAKMAETIDDISRGNFVLGLGCGWHASTTCAGSPSITASIVSRRRCRSSRRWCARGAPASRASTTRRARRSTSRAARAGAKAARPFCSARTSRA